MNIRSVNRLALGIVSVVLCLIFVGALVTSWQAGMAVPDWPLSFGSLNPAGWWGKFEVRLEHGHRLLAALVGILVGILCASVWGNWRALGWAALVSVVVSSLSRRLGAEPWLLAHLSVWPAAVVFLSVLPRGQRSPLEIGKVERRLAVTAFVLVCVQATLGGLRVTRETAGYLDVAVALRVMHGCVAQLFLIVLVSLWVRTGLASGSYPPHLSGVPPSTCRMSWMALCAVYIQLIVGASMRHIGAGLAIPSFPSASFDGSWLPKAHNIPTDLNFLHTRVGAVVVTLLVCMSAISILKNLSSHRGLRFAAIRSLILVAIQVTLGVLVIWHLKPPTLATFHVLVGALLLANLALTLVQLSGYKSNATQGGLP